MKVDTDPGSGSALQPMRIHTTTGLTAVCVFYYLAPELSGGQGELEGRVEVVLLLVAPVYHFPLPHHQEPGVTWTGGTRSPH